MLNELSLSNHKNVQFALSIRSIHSQLIRYSRACVSYLDFLDKGLLLTNKLLNQGFLTKRLKSSLGKFYGRHHDFIDWYEVTVSQMTKDLFLCRNYIPSPPRLWLFLDFTFGSPGGAEHAYPSGAPDVTPFSGVQVTQSLVFCVICFTWCPCCVSLFAMALSVHFDCMTFWPRPGFGFFDFS